MKIRELPDNFIGVGEVSGFKFNKLASIDKGFLYEVLSDDTSRHYEVFERKLTPICIDFEKRIYSETEFKVKYPKANDFGVWAWAYSSPELALAKLETLNK
jgi:hypothetical protein